MSDLLIRNLDDLLKQQLQESAKHSGRSLSDEAIYVIRRNLIKEHSVSAGDWLRTALGDERLTEEEIPQSTHCVMNLTVTHRGLTNDCSGHEYRFGASGASA